MPLQVIVNAKRIQKILNKYKEYEVNLETKANNKDKTAKNPNKIGT